MFDQLIDVYEIMVQFIMNINSHIGINIYDFLEEISGFFNHHFTASYFQANQKKNGNLKNPNQLKWIRIS